MIFQSHYKIIKKSGLFDERYYLTTYEDVRKADIDPIKHYIKYGWKEGRNPSAIFDTNKYIQENNISENSRYSPLFHQIKSLSNKEKNIASEYNTIKKSYLFDKKYYLKTCPDIKNANIDPIEHFMEYGWQEGRNPSDKFDTNFYLETYKDVKDANINPLIHFIKYGKKEKRKILPEYKQVFLINKLTILIRPMYSRSSFLRKLFKKFTNIRNKLLLHNLPTSSSQNKLALDELTKRRFEYTNNFFDKNNQVTQNEQIEIDISVVTYNSSKWIDNFFKSLLAQNYPTKKINIYFIDNSSKDNTIEILQNYKDKEKDSFNSIFIISQKNLGFGAGHDRTFKEGKSEFCLVSNIDLEFEKDSISNVLNIALDDKHEEYASWEFRQVPYEHPKYYDPITLETNWSSHACILIRKSAYEKVGGYEPKIFMYAEDVELSYRFRAFGYHLKYCPSAVVRHFTYEEANQVKPLQFQGSTLGNAYLRLRYGNKIDKLVIFPLFIALFIRKEQFKDARKLIFKNLLKIIKNKKYFEKFDKSNSEFYAPFREFDYEIIRDGSFHKIKQPLEKPLVSIIVRTYKNREMLLKQALISIANQTYKNLEVIIVEDDGNTMEKIVSKMSSFLNIKFFGLDKVERSVTGNYGLSQATGEYCIFLDDDDLFFADHIEVLVESLIKNPQASATYSLAFQVPTRFFDENKTTYVEGNMSTLKVFYQEFDYEILKDHNYFPIQTVLFKKNLFLEKGGFDETLVHLEDWNLWLRYAFNNYFHYVPKTTSLYRVPLDDKVNQERQELLDKAYYNAKNSAFQKIKKINENK